MRTAEPVALVVLRKVQEIVSLAVESGGMKTEILCKMSQAKCCILMQIAGDNGYTL
jgi:hypothetical protein